MFNICDLPKNFFEVAYKKTFKPTKKKPQRLKQTCEF